MLQSCYDKGSLVGDISDPPPESYLTDIGAKNILKLSALFIKGLQVHCWMKNASFVVLHR